MKAFCHHHVFSAAKYNLYGLPGHSGNHCNVQPTQSHLFSQGFSLLDHTPEAPYERERERDSIEAEDGGKGIRQEIQLALLRWAKLLFYTTSHKLCY
jgi:hypothetical protein